MTQTPPETLPPLPDQYGPAPGALVPAEAAPSMLVSGASFPQGERCVASPTKPLTIYDEVARRSDKFSLLLKGTDVSAERFIYAFQLEWNRNPKLQNCHKDSLIQALLRCAEMGLMPGVGAYLIPYNGVAQMQVSLQGWLTLLWRSGNVGNITYGLHREGDAFGYCIEQTGTTLYHKPKLEMDGEILGAYAMVTLKNQHVQLKYCNRKEIEASKDASKSKKPESPWFSHFDQMAQIVPLRKLARILAPSLCEWRSEETALPDPKPLQEALEVENPPSIRAS